MSQGDNFPPPYGSGDFGGSAGGPPPKRGMSTTAKVLLILGGVFGVMMLLCCGGALWFYSKMGITQNPQQVQAIQRQIVDIQVPEGYQPQMGMDMSVGPVTMKMAVFVSEGGMLMLMQMPEQSSEEEMRQKMEESLQQQGKNQQINVDSRKTRTVVVDGQEVEFDFIEGTHADSGGKVRQVIGQFPGRGGTVMLMLVVPEDQWDEDEVMEMLQSIKR